MQFDEPRARIAHQPTAISRAKQIATKAVILVGGVLMLASAFVVSLAFLAIGAVVVLTAGGYLWWKTRDLRKQLRARMQPHASGDIIEGEVVSRERPGAHLR